MTDAQKQFIATVRKDLKSDSAREVAAHIASPVMQSQQVARTITKPAEQLAWEQAALADMERMQELLTGSKANAIASLARSTSVQRAVAQRAVKSANPAKVAELTALSTALLDHRSEAKERGLWPLPDHFGQAEYTETETIQTPGPSAWESAFPGEPLPTLEEVAEAMQ
jgi:hypothetical protein